MAINNSKLTINGHQVRATHSATIGSVLSDHSSIPKVSSKGQSFYNADSWTLRTFCKEMCQWASRNPNCIPTEEIIVGWIRTANNLIGSLIAEIVIAATGDQLDRSMLLALVGGGYHEAWHTRYSKRDRLDPKVVVPNVLKRWALVQNWAPFHNELQKWNNIVEDIRIERVGIKEFPPTRHSMVELQDFVLNLEKQGLENARSHGHSGERNALSVVTGTFRDLGLGYTESSLQREALLAYEKDNKQGYDLVNTGALRPLLDKAINLTTSKEDAYECLWIAMDVIAVLVDESDDDENGGGGTSGETKCPKCGASKDKLKIRKGNQGQYLLVCTDCGHQQEIELSDGDGGQGEGESFEMENPDDKSDNSEKSDKSDDTNSDDGDQNGDGNGGDSDQTQDQDGDKSDSDGDNGNSNKPPVYKVGDRALLNGTEVVVVKASKPDANGLQQLEVEPV